jgi:hypothetical protein
MYYDDHNPPHYHAEYAGDLPSRALGLVYEWAGKHRAELREAWKRAKNLEPTGKIEPLE